MRAKRINSDIAHLNFFFASGASDFTQVSRIVGRSTWRTPGSRERHSGPPEWWQFEAKRATAMTIETKVSDHSLRQSQRRGISRETLDVVLTYHDRSRKLPGYARALWIFAQIANPSPKVNAVMELARAAISRPVAGRRGSGRTSSKESSRTVCNPSTTEPSLSYCLRHDAGPFVQRVRFSLGFVAKLRWPASQSFEHAVIADAIYRDTVTNQIFEHDVALAIYFRVDGTNGFVGPPPFPILDQEIGLGMLAPVTRPSDFSAAYTRLVCLNRGEFQPHPNLPRSDSP
jgi:hypothetical protein